MYCIKCGKEISDNSKFCRYCGTVIEDEDTDFDDNFAESSDAKSKKGRGTKALLAALIILLICLVIGGAGAGVRLCADRSAAGCGSGGRRHDRDAQGGAQLDPAFRHHEGKQRGRVRLRPGRPDLHPVYEPARRSSPDRV